MDKHSYKVEKRSLEYPKSFGSKLYSYDIYKDKEIIGRVYESDTRDGKTRPQAGAGLLAPLPSRLYSDSLDLCIYILETASILLF